jgi:hypothetical protein
MHPPTDIHGESGLDGTDLLPEPTVPPNTTIPAVDAAAAALKAEAPGTAWLVATGSFTNAAALFLKYPDLASHVKGISLMGGAIGGGFTNAVLGHVEGVARIGNWYPPLLLHPLSLINTQSQDPIRRIQHPRRPRSSRLALREQNPRRQNHAHPARLEPPSPRHGGRARSAALRSAGKQARGEAKVHAEGDARGAVDVFCKDLYVCFTLPSSIRLFWREKLMKLP